MRRVKRELDRLGVLYRADVAGASLTTFGSGGEAAVVAYPKSVSELKALLLFFEKEGVRYRVLGAGSNVLFPDEGYRGVILRLDSLNAFSVVGSSVTVGAGLPMPVFARKCREAGLSGAEYAEGIPGKIGGAVYMNASAFGMGVSDALRTVNILLDGEEMTLPTSALKMEYHRGGIAAGALILSATFDFREGEEDRIAEKMRELARKRAASQPFGRSAGSVFRRVGEKPAALYIEETGLKGKVVGGAELSTKHCNFIMNRGGAKTEDFFALAEEVRRAVKERTGVTLEYETERILC